MKKFYRALAILGTVCLMAASVACRTGNSMESEASVSQTVSDTAGSEGATSTFVDSDKTQGVTGNSTLPSGLVGSASSTKTGIKDQTPATTRNTSATSYKENGDTSYSITMKGLSPNTLYSVSKDVLIGAKNIMGHDILRLFVSLQGLINRDFKKNSIALIIEPYDSSETFWINYISKSGAPLHGMVKKKISSLTEFLDVFKNQLISCGMVTWDPNVPSTSNVAATICGLDGYLPVKYEDNYGSLMVMLKELGVKVKLNLKGKFTGKGIINGTKIASTGSAKCDAYLWAMDKYMARCSTKYMLYMADGASCTADNIIYQKDSCSKDPFGAVNLVSHDYGIARRAFFFDLSPVSSEAPCDDRNQKIGTDLKTMQRLFTRRYELAGGNFGCMVGFPPWQLKYSKHNSWGSVADTTLESLFVQECTKYNMYLDVSCTQINTSIYCHYPLRTSYSNGSKAVSEKFNNKTIYIYYHLGDYDAAGWVTTHMLRAYQDSSRGKIPLTWAINPGMSDRIPMAFDYFYSNLTAADTICASDSGVGYFSPQCLFQDDSLVDGRSMPDGNQKLIAASKPYFKKFDMDVVSFIIGQMSNKAYATYNNFAPKGSFHYDRAKPIAIYNGTPYVPTKNGVGNPGDYLNSAKGMYDYLTTTMKGTNFLATRTICWTPSELISLTKVFESFASQHMPGYTFKVVNAYNFLDLVKQSGQGKIIKE